MACVDTSRLDMLPALPFSQIINSLSREDKRTYALTCKENARQIFKENDFWRNVIIPPESEHFSKHMKRHPDWSYDRIVTFGRFSDASVVDLATKAKHFEFWCPVLRDILQYFENNNIYRGPDCPINPISSKHKFYKQSLKDYLQDCESFSREFPGLCHAREHFLDIKAQAFAFLRNSDALVDLVNTPIQLESYVEDIFDDLAYPNSARCTIVNPGGWNDDPRSRHIEDDEECFRSLKDLGLTLEECDEEFDGHEFTTVEPRGWYADFVSEITIEAPLTWRKIFEAYLKVKSGRNDGDYEFLCEAKVNLSDKDHVKIFLDFVHGSL